MGLVLRVQVIKARNLAPKDKSGTSDPFLILHLGDAKEATSVVNKTLNPEWHQTFEFPVTAAESALLEVVCWDKDRFKKDYMGEFEAVLEDIFVGGVTMPEQKWMKLESKRNARRKKKDENVTGEVLMKFTLYDPLNTSATSQQVWHKFHGLVAATPDEDMDGDESEMLHRMTSRELADLFEEDEADDHEDEKEPSDETDDGMRTPNGTPDQKMKRRRQQKLKKMKRHSKRKTYEFGGASDVAGVLFLEINRITDLPPEKKLYKNDVRHGPFCRHLAR